MGAGLLRSGALRRVVDELPTLRAPRASKREVAEEACLPAEQLSEPVLPEDRPSEVPENSRSLGRYRLLFKLASGGMGSVYAAVGRGPEGVDRTFAIKLINPARSGPRSSDRARAELDAFIREARLTARIAHPNVLETFELGVERGEPFIVMPLVRGVSLAELVEALSTKGEQLRVELGVWIAMQVAAGLHAAHELAGSDGTTLGLVHRDVSPQNVLLGYDGSVKLLDFGVAKLFEAGRQTTEGVVKGKFGYMSPEQVLGEPIDRRSDIFALGVVLYELVAGAPLYSNLAPGVAALRTATEAPPRLSKHLEGQDALDAVLQRALAKAPSDRFGSAAEMLESLRAILRDNGTTHDASELVVLLARHFGDKRRELEERLREATHRAESSPPTPSTTPLPVGARTAPIPASAKLQHRPSGSRLWLVGLLGAGTLAVLVAVLLSRDGDDVVDEPSPTDLAASSALVTTAATTEASVAPPPRLVLSAPSAASSSTDAVPSFVRKTAGISTAARSVVIVTTATAMPSKPSSDAASASASVKGQPFRNY